MPLSTEARAFIDAATAAGGKPFHQMTHHEARTAADEMLRASAGARPEMSEVRDVLLPVEGGEILLRVLAPASPRGSILYFHGGGWVFGTADNHDTFGRQLAAATGCIVVLADYRLAPEHPYPTPLNDCLAAADWALATLPGPVVVGGDSAGGNLAAAVTQRLAARGRDGFAAQILVYPVTDAAMDTDSYRDPENDLLLSPKDMAWFWEAYVPDPDARADAGCSVLRCADLDGLPPASVILAGYDVLRDEGQAYADRLAASNVPVRLHVEPHELHGFVVLGALFPAAARAMQAIARHLEALGVLRPDS